jgi:hypothetical protein
LRTCFCGAPSLTRERVCLSYMLLALASAVFLGSKSLGTRDDILLPQIWDFLFVDSCDSQGHGGGIRPRLQTGTHKVKVKVTLRLTVSQSVSKSWLCMLLPLASAVFLGSKSLGTRDNILLSQIWDFLFVASYDSQGHGGGIRPRLDTGWVLTTHTPLVMQPWHGPHRKPLQTVILLLHYVAIARTT